MPPSAEQLLQPSLISLEIAATDKDAAILEVAGLLRSHPAVSDFTLLCDELIARDSLRSTAVGNGIAFPHARTLSVSDLLIAVGRSSQGVPFGEEIVHFLFVIATPRDRVAAYLGAVGALSRALRDGQVRETLTTAPDAGAFICALTR